MDGVLPDVSLDNLQSEVRFRDGGKAGDPIIDRELGDDGVSGGHGRWLRA